MAEIEGPKHIGIVVDGNRRFAKRLMQKPWKGHEWGKVKVEKLFTWCWELGIKELTLYVFSMQNLNRPKEEFDFLMELNKKAFGKFKSDPRIEEYGIKVRILGRIEIFPEDVQKLLIEIQEKTKNNNNFFINFALGYGGREEIIDAVKNLSKDIAVGKIKTEDITEDSFSKYLYMEDEPDLIIRTGGEIRTSNFLPWQSIYSEWIFMKDKLWPEFEKEDLIRCIEEFKTRKRRFGK